MLRWIFVALLVLHGLIHLMGPAKAFGWADLPQLTQPISRPMAGLWLLATVLLLVAAVQFLHSPRWWMAAGVAVVVSQVVILSSWTDAKYGTIANLIILGVAVLGYLATGHSSFTATYRREVNERLGHSGSAGIVTEADVARLPALLQQYLRVAGAVGQPRIHNFRARMRGDIRSGPGAPWMAFTSEQHNFLDQPARLFLMDATRSGLPVQAYHRYVGPSATMRVKLASLIPVVNAKGPEMDQAETVTLFNDCCIFAPGSLIGPGFEWQGVDAHTVRGSYTNAGHTVRAVLTFGDAGELIDFGSDDRTQASSDGKTFTRVRWSTPVGEYRRFGAVRLAGTGEAHWHPASGEFAYLRLTIDEVAYNLGAP